MYKIVIILLIFAIFIQSQNEVKGQEPNLATFQEISQVIIELMMFFQNLNIRLSVEFLAES